MKVLIHARSLLRSAPNPEGPHVRVHGPAKALSRPSSTHAVHIPGPSSGYPSGLRVPTQGAELALGGQTRGSRLRTFGQGIPEFSEP